MAYRVLQAVVVALLASQISAQFSGLPTCAQGCVDIGAGPVGCTASDLQCLCGSRPFLATVRRCISQDCEDPDDAALGQQIIQNTCDSTTGTGTSTGTFTGTRSDTSSSSSSSSSSSTSSLTTPTTLSSTSELSTTSITTPSTTSTQESSPTTTSTSTSITVIDTSTSTGTSVPPLATPTFTTKSTASLTNQNGGSPIQTQGSNGAMVTPVSTSFLESLLVGMIGAALLAI